MGGDLEDPSRGADTQALGHTRQNPHDQLHRRLFAMEEGAMGLQKVALTRGTVELAPGAAPGMTAGAEILQHGPAPNGTTPVRATSTPRADRPAAPVGR